MSMERHAVIIFGVSGAGKTSVAKALAARTGGKMLDADDFHPAANIARMAQGLALTDAERMPWLTALAQAMGAWWESSDPWLVLACSALKHSYRDMLRVLPRGVVSFVYLRGTPGLLQERLRHRDATGGHFMKSTLLASQLLTLEEPTPADESDCRTVDLGDPSPKSVEELVDEIVAKLGFRR